MIIFSMFQTFYIKDIHVILCLTRINLNHSWGSTKNGKKADDTHQIRITRHVYWLHDRAINPSRLQGVQASPKVKIAIRRIKLKHFRNRSNISLLRYRTLNKKVYSYPNYDRREKNNHRVSGMDSDLEAFSHNPADGSFAALPGRTAANTNYLNERFLSY